MLFSFTSFHYSRPRLTTAFVTRLSTRKQGISFYTISKQALRSSCGIKKMVLRTGTALAPTIPVYKMASDMWQDVDSDDFALIEKPQELALRPRTRSQTEDQTSVDIHPLREGDAFIVSVQPPNTPNGLERATCDIVLVIDVSGSMASAAPLPEGVDKNDKEAAGLSVLDLVKHAAKTILETLGPDDRLGIVTFSDDATVRI